MGGNGLHGFGDAGGARRPGGTRVTTMHAAVHGTNARTVATGGTLTSQALARILLLGLAELGDFLAKLGDFGEEGFHWGVGVFGGGGSLRAELITFASTQRAGRPGR